MPGTTLSAFHILTHLIAGSWILQVGDQISLIRAAITGPRGSRWNTHGRETIPGHIDHLPISPGAGSPPPHGLPSAAPRQSSLLAQPGPAVWLQHPAPALPGSVQCPVQASGTSLPLTCQGQDQASASSFYLIKLSLSPDLMSNSHLRGPAPCWRRTSNCLPLSSCLFNISMEWSAPHPSWVLTLDYFLGLSDSLNLDLQLPLGDLYHRILLLGFKQTAL